MLMASGYADARSPPLRPAEATITVAIEKAHAVILRPGLYYQPASRRLRAGNDATVAGDPTSCGAAGRPILAWAPGEDGLNSEKDNPQEPRPGGRRASPPAPGRLGPWGSSAPRGTPTAFPSLARERSRPTTRRPREPHRRHGGWRHPPPSGSPSGPVGPSGRNSNPDFPVQPRRPLGATLDDRTPRGGRQGSVSAGQTHMPSSGR